MSLCNELLTDSERSTDADDSPGSLVYVIVDHGEYERCPDERGARDDTLEFPYDPTLLLQERGNGVRRSTRVSRKPHR